MFTGIVEEVGSVISASAERLVITASNVVPGMKHGGSIAVNGVCLTVTNFDSKSFSVDIMPETLRCTNLGQLHSGDRINLERPLALGGELGGHLVQGHIDETGRLASTAWENGAMLLRIEASPEVLSFVVPKGFIAVDGASLTIATRDAGSFWVSIVDYTRQHTTLGDSRIGDLLNLEVDIMAKYVAQFSQPQHTGITVDFLQEHGFSAS